MLNLVSYYLLYAYKFYECVSGNFVSADFGNRNFCSGVQSGVLQPKIAIISISRSFPFVKQS